MSHGFSVQFPMRPELVLKLSVTLSVHDTVGELYQEKKQPLLSSVNGMNLKRLIPSYWLMKVIGKSSIIAAGLQFYRNLEKVSILCKMGYCSTIVYISYLIAMLSQLTLMCIYVLYIPYKGINKGINS